MLYEEPYAQELDTCILGPCYNSTLRATGINVICRTGKNVNPRFRFKIKASYIVSAECDVRRVNNGWIPYWPLKPNKHLEKYANIQYFI